MIKHFIAKMFYPFCALLGLFSRTNQSNSLSAGADSRVADLCFKAVLSSIAGLSRFVQPQGTETMRPLLNRTNTHGVS